MNRPLAAGTSRVPPKPPAVATQRVSVSHLGAPRKKMERKLDPISGETRICCPNACPPAFAFLHDIWLPLPDGLRIRRHPNCDKARQSLYLCRFCPTLLTAVPANRQPGRVTHSRFAGMLPKYPCTGQLRDADFCSPGSLRPGCASVAAV
jgi:hypothetical protein